MKTLITILLTTILNFHNKSNPFTPFQGYRDIRFVQEEPAAAPAEEDEDAEDYETQPYDCTFLDAQHLPKSITLCVRDSFLKKNIDGYAKDLKKKSTALETGILNGYKAFSELGPFSKEFDNKEEGLKYSLDVEMVQLKDDNDPEAKIKKSDVREKVFEMEDVDPDAFVAKMQAQEAAGKPVTKNADGSYQVPKFELNYVLKIKRKYVTFKNMKFKDLNDASAEEITNNADYYMPTFLMRKGIRVNWDKEKSALVSACYEPETESYINDEQIFKNFDLHSESNFKRINNEFVIDFRGQLVKDVFDKATAKFGKLFSGLDCKYMDKFNALLKPFDHPIAGFGSVGVSVKDLDYLTNMDANMPLNWFDIRYKMENKAEVPPVPYITDLCGEPSKDKKNAIKYKEEVYCNQDSASDVKKAAPKKKKAVKENKEKDTKTPEKPDTKKATNTAEKKEEAKDTKTSKDQAKDEKKY